MNELMQEVLSQLLSNAGPRGATFLGRHIMPTDSLGIRDVMARLPTGELESGSLAMEAPSLLRAMIPAAWWLRGSKSAMKYAPEIKASMNVFADRYPETFKKILEHPSPLSITREKFDAVPYLGRLVRPVEGGPSTAVTGMHLVEGATKDPLLRTLTHELGHFVEGGRLARTDPLDAETIALLLLERNPKLLRSTASVRHRRLASEKGALRQKGEVINPDSARAAEVAKAEEMIPMLQKSLLDEVLANLYEAQIGKDVMEGPRVLARKLGMELK